jgi:hypothetical protein
MPRLRRLTFDAHLANGTPALDRLRTRFGSRLDAM